LQFYGIVAATTESKIGLAGSLAEVSDFWTMKQRLTVSENMIDSLAWLRQTGPLREKGLVRWTFTS
jgi:hypothetical protein